jgi:hypothetical protein
MEAEVGYSRALNMARRNASSIISTTVVLLAVLIANLENSARAAGNNAAQQLVREVIENECRAEDNEASDNILWSYREKSRHDGRELLLQYCETKYGTIHRLLAVNGHPLDAVQRQAEDKRIQKLIVSPDALAADQRKEKADAAEERKMLKLFPVAFRYTEEKREGDLVTVRFTPDPDYSPSGYEERAIHALTGTIVLNVSQKRLVSVSGHLMYEVKFWGGLAGYLDAGGTFAVESQNVAPGDWELKSLDVDMRGRIFLFKSLSVQEHESYWGFTPVPPAMTLAQAAKRLENEPAR